MVQGGGLEPLDEEERRHDGRRGLPQLPQVWCAVLAADRHDALKKIVQPRDLLVAAQEQARAMTEFLAPVDAGVLKGECCARESQLVTAVEHPQRPPRGEPERVETVDLRTQLGAQRRGIVGTQALDGRSARQQRIPVAAWPFTQTGEQSDPGDHHPPGHAGHAVTSAQSRSSTSRRAVATSLPSASAVAVNSMTAPSTLVTDALITTWSPGRTKCLKRTACAERSRQPSPPAISSASETMLSSSSTPGSTGNLGK